MDIDNLVRELRDNLRGECSQAADALESLQRENADLRQRCDHIMTEHGKRVDENVRLKVELEHYTMAANAEAKYGDEARAERDRLRAELEEARRESEQLKDVLRLDPGRLEIRMSIEDFHIRQFVPVHALGRAGDPARIVEQHARAMYQELEDAQAARQQTS